MVRFYKRSVGFCIIAILLLEASRIALFMLDGNVEAHACVCNNYTCTESIFRIYAECSILHIQGIYHCTILDMNMKFCENFKQSRISADKRFLNYFNPTYSFL